VAGRPPPKSAGAQLVLPALAVTGSTGARPAAVSRSALASQLNDAA
jgi:hypothetical protein